MHALTRIKRTTAPIAVLFALAVTGWAQDNPPSFADLGNRLQPGDRVRVVAGDGTESEGRLAGITRDSLSLTAGGSGQSFSASEVREVKRRGHVSTGLGGALGALGGAITGLVICETSDREGACSGSRGLTSAFYAGLGTGIGVVTAFVIPQWRPVYTRPDGVTVRLTPVYSVAQLGVGVSLSF